MRLRGKIALVTGAASGIGRATCLLMAREGAIVIAGDRDLAGVEQLAREAGGISPVLLDVTDDASFAAAVDLTINEFGRLDILFNNAGAGGTPLAIGDMEMAAWDATMSLLLRSVALGIRLATPAMVKAGGGAIVNTASVAALSAGNGPIAYSVAKAGVLHMTKVAAAQLGRQNIRVNAVCPGLILTGIFTASYRDAAPELAADVRAYMERTAAEAQPLKHAGQPEDVAETVVFLASDAARFVTGAHLLVDGGLQVGGRQSWDPNVQRAPDHPLTKALAAQTKERGG